MDNYDPLLDPAHGIEDVPYTRHPDRVDKRFTWQWMHTVYVRVYSTTRVNVSFHRTATPLAHEWDDSPFALIAQGELDLFEPPKRFAAKEIVPYPMRIVSLPGDHLQVGDRRMIRPTPGAAIGNFDVILIAKGAGTTSSIQLTIGGTAPIHTFELTEEEFRKWFSPNAKCIQTRMYQISLHGLTELQSTPASTLEERFDRLLGDVENIATWIASHRQTHSLCAALRRIQAIESDESRFSHWIRAQHH